MDIVEKLRNKCEGWQIGASICGGPAPVEELAAVEIERMRDRIERLRGMLKSCAGWFLDLDRVDLHERCMDAAGDMEAPIEKTPNGEVRGASRLAGEASSAEGATSTVVLGDERPGKD